MQRLVYVPRVEAYVKLDDTKRGFKTLDLTDDIVSGSITRRLSAVSEASITLQNKNGRYTSHLPIRPMDRIVIRLGRVGPTFPAFSGYINASPYYQLYPGTITIKASCPLKLLQYTFFDPGLPYLQQYFKQFGWNYDFTSGALMDYQGGAFATFGDPQHGIASVLRHTLIDIANWPEDAIDIKNIPDSFIQEISGVMARDVTAEKATEETIFNHLKKMLSLTDTQIPRDDLDTPSSAVHGNVTPVQAAKFALDAGFKGDNLVTAVAIAMAESSLQSDAENFNSDGSYDFGLWQINSVHKGSDTIEVFRQKMFDPRKNAAKAFEVSSGGTNFTPWVTYNNGLHKPFLARARTGVGIALQGVFITIPDSASSTSTDTPVQRQSTSTAKFIFPIKPYEGFTYTVTAQGYFGNDRGTHLHAGVDIPANEGTPLVACVDGTILANTTQSGIGGGNYVVVQDKDSSYTYVYMHMAARSALRVGSHVTRGQIIGYVGHSGTDSGFNHLHFEVHPQGGFKYESAIDPAPTLRRAWNNGDLSTTAPSDNAAGGAGGVPGTAPNAASGGPVDAEEAKTIALQASWFTLQLQGSNDVTLANQIYQGVLSLANDITFLNWINNMMQASGRVFTTKPDGTFFAFFPDRFGYYADTPYFRISDVEIVDLTVDINDFDLTTHVFAAGNLTSGSFTNITEIDRLRSIVASVESSAFQHFIGVSVDDPMTKEQDGSFDPFSFLKKYGARPYTEDFQGVRNPTLLWMAAWMKFTELWAKQYTASAQFTFLPEILPGGLVEFYVNQHPTITMFVESVTHVFDRQSGFRTDAELSSPSTPNPQRFPGLPITGGSFEEEPQTIDPSQFFKDLANG